MLVSTKRFIEMLVEEMKNDRCAGDLMDIGDMLGIEARMMRQNEFEILENEDE